MVINAVAEESDEMQTGVRVADREHIGCLLLYGSHPDVGLIGLSRPEKVIA